MHPSARDGYRDRDGAAPTKAAWPVEGEDYPANEMLPVEGAEVQLGKPEDFPSFGWDNGYGQRIAAIPDFRASRHMITNGAYWHFVTASGYHRPEH